MARTPKIVRRNGGYCVCPQPVKTTNMRENFFRDGTCKRGYCYSAKCWDCCGELFSMGPITCQCEHPRWCRYPGMEQPGHWDPAKDEFVPARAAVKPSIARRHRA